MDIILNSLPESPSPESASVPTVTDTSARSSYRHILRASSIKGSATAALPIAEAIANEVLSLLIGPHLSPDFASAVITHVKGAADA
jgi:dTDP-4-amino-4,6-dideoxygalactose transaminase